MPQRMSEGLYEALLTEELERRLEPTRAAGLSPILEALSEHEPDVLVARHVLRELLATFAELRGDERDADRLRLGNALLALLNQGRAHPPARSILPSAQVLTQVALPGTTLGRTESPLSVSTLLTGAESEPRLGLELERELETADRLDMLVSFITREGWRRLEPAFLKLAARGKPVRILTTTYTGATDADAVLALARLPNTQVKVSYDGRRSRLHAKAWLFQRESGFGCAYVGSANLSRVALGGGLEWTMKVTQADLPHVLDKFRGTFETLWEDAEFEPFDAASAEALERLQQALLKERGGGASPTPLTRFLVSLRPYPFQEEVLDRLATERAVHGRRRNLVVAATGTGKTMIAAFDYARQVPASGVRPRLLFAAHREELLLQSLETFRHVLRDHAFGELLGGGHEPSRVDHLFTTVQSLRSRRLAETYPADHWDYVVIDECHHSTASTYTDLVDRLKPKELLGLTATPERADGASVLDAFGGRTAAELRLWHALERQLLTPFEYYGVSDGVDLSRVGWARGAYDVTGLDELYTGNDRRAELVLEQLRRSRGALREARILGFCASVAHAEFMARKFTEAGVPAAEVHGGTSKERRAELPRQLEQRAINALFTCDLYNEGIDLPFLDTLLLLRPTASATVFLQQLGRGLRLHPGKSSCLVLDFIGNARAEFRFDRLLTAMTGVPRGGLRQAVERGFPTLPSGCHLSLDRTAQQQILEHLRQALGGGLQRLAGELEEVSRRHGPALSLETFLAETGRPLEDVYAVGGFTRLRRASGLLEGAAPPEEEQLGKKLELLLHLDDPERLEQLRALAAGTVVASTALERRRLLMLGYQLWRQSDDRFDEAEVLTRFERFPELRRELGELAGQLLERVSLAPVAGGLPPEWPLALHRTYSRDELLTAVGLWTRERKPSHREGLIRLPNGDELLLVTLVKTEAHFSPSTRYRDYAISQGLFHWQSQAGTSEESSTGQGYLRQATNGRRFYLCVRKHQSDRFRFLGDVKYVKHEGERPLSITWRMVHPIPAALLQEYATLAAA